MPYLSPIRPPHPNFPQPDHGDLRVWRYLSLERFISLLQIGGLPLTRVDRFHDAFEGSVSRGVVEHPFNAERRESLGQMRADMRHGSYASCWHGNEDESEAMWRLYCPSGLGVALQTTYAKLDAALPPELLMGMITYVNYDSAALDPFVAFNGFAPLMQKRRAFQHEREIRVIAWLGTARETVPLTPGDQGDVPTVLKAPWDVAAAIEHVFVNPYAEEWFNEVCRGVVEKFAPALAERVSWSSMKGQPRF